MNTIRTTVLILSICLSCHLFAQTFSVILIPDTQMYTASSTWYGANDNKPLREMYSSQIDWIVSQKDALDIRFVIHVGDLVENEDNTDEWDFASNEQAKLDNNDIPTGISPGNHDVEEAVYANGHNYFLDYFPASRYAGFDWYSGNSGDNMNSFQTFEVHGINFLCLNLAWGIRDDPSLIHWANDVLRMHPQHRVIVNTHGVQAYDGNVVWNQIIKHHDNVFLFVGGHTCGGVWQDQRYSNGGSPVQMIKVDFQCQAFGGDGKLAIYRFDMDSNTISQEIYSPYKDYSSNGTNCNISWSYSLDPLSPPVDCNGDYQGMAQNTLCGQCVGGNTGLPIPSVPADCITSIQGSAEVSSLQLSPNPATDYINLSFATEYRIINTLGMNIQKGNEKHIDLTSLSAGQYILQTPVKTIRFQKE